MISIPDLLYEYELCLYHAKNRNWYRVLDPVLFGSAYEMSKTYRIMIEYKYKE